MHSTTHLSDRDRPSRRDANRRVFWIAFAAGVGFMGALDAAVFHHLLRWHNFYVHAGADWRALSDGILHVLTTGLLFASPLLLWRNRHLISRGQADSLSLAAGVWLGMGAFQFVDGTLFHTVLRLHPVREGAENPLVYDALWIGSSLVLLAIGWLVLRRVR
ncbi:hypothetical protein BH23DEI1_BH23DEI1_10280 [soil metagenome]|nr:DUF2243 domain-containing protein [Trueperaceae bacterium]